MLGHSPRPEEAEESGAAATGSVDKRAHGLRARSSSTGVSVAARAQAAVVVDSTPCDYTSQQQSSRGPSTGGSCGNPEWVNVSDFGGGWNLLKSLCESEHSDSLSWWLTSEAGDSLARLSLNLWNLMLPLGRWCQEEVVAETVAGI